jgi:haloacetate dehalogenase
VRRTVVAPPPDAPDHAQASKRAMAVDVVVLMDALRHDRFAVAGHDRGSYVALRTAMDRADRVAALTGIGGWTGSR